jgi:penicillin-binding protein 1C
MLLRILRVLLVTVLLPLTIVVQLLLALVVLVPFDKDDLEEATAPLVLLDVRGEQIATLGSQWTKLGDVPAIAVSAVIESEDQNFWSHRGVDAEGLARALWLDAHGGRFGGSTLTMQLARMIRGDNQRSIPNKVKETLLAMRIERAVDKRTILEQWMNRAYFGNGAVGFDAAAHLYFGKAASALSPGEATLLAVIPRAPSAYDPLRHLDAAKKRRAHVLQLLVERGVIDAATVADIDAEQVAVARHETKNAAPHFTQWVLDQLPPDVRRAGGTLQTTLDLRLQKLLERRVREQVAALRGVNLAQAGVIVLDAQTTEVRAMVGSTDFAQSQIDITTRRRNPGSALKPFVYATAIEHGAAPVTIAWDTRDTNVDFFAPNSGVEHGPVRYREALASSYNFAAVDVLASVGIARVMSVLREAGVAELPGAPDDYGLRLALGAAKVRLIDLAAGYGFLVNGGVVGTPRGIVGTIAPGGTRWSPPHAPERRIFTPQTSWLVMDMLSDPEARRPGFGMELPFDLPFRIAAKTGTARGFADTWAVGATREVIVGAWAGTFDGSPMQGIVGMDAAAPLVRDAMLAVSAEAGRPLTLPARPSGIDDVEVCADTGMPVVDAGQPGADESVTRGDRCPRVADHVAHGYVPHDPGITRDDRGVLHYPARATGWLHRTGRLAER